MIDMLRKVPSKTSVYNSLNNSWNIPPKIKDLFDKNFKK